MVKDETDFYVDVRIRYLSLGMKFRRTMRYDRGKMRVTNPRFNGGWKHSPTATPTSLILELQDSSPP
jgi:hypothetical protein